MQNDSLASCAWRVRVTLPPNSYRGGQVALELLLALALLVVISPVVVGGLRGAGEVRRRSKEMSISLRREVWFLGRLRSTMAASRRDEIPRIDEQVVLDRTPLANVSTEETSKITVVRFKMEDLLLVRLRPDQPAWLIGGLPQTRRWPP